MSDSIVEIVFKVRIRDGRVADIAIDRDGATEHVERLRLVADIHANTLDFGSVPAISLSAATA